MGHPIYRVTAIDLLGTYRLRISFDDGSIREIDLEPVLAGEIYGPLRDPSLFASVEIDPEVHTLVWPNGADFDPAILHDWPGLQFFGFSTAGIVSRYGCSVFPELEPLELCSSG